MLKAINKKTNLQILANDAIRTDTFLCPGCNEELNLKKGIIKIAHFSHKTNSHCGWGSGESLDHQKTKNIFYNYFKNLGYNIELEVNLGKIDYKNYRQADIIINNKYIIEIQNSTQTYEKYIERTEAYKNLGYEIIWIGLMEDEKQYNRKNYSSANLLNGGYDIYLLKNNISIDGIYKVFNNSKIKFNSNILNLKTDLFEFLFYKETFFPLKYDIYESSTELRLLTEKIDNKHNYLKSINNKIKIFEEEAKKKELELLNRINEEEAKIIVIKKQIITLEQKKSNIEEEFKKKTSEEQKKKEIYLLTKLNEEEKKVRDIKKQITILEQKRLNVEEEFKKDYQKYELSKQKEKIEYEIKCNNELKEITKKYNDFINNYNSEKKLKTEELEKFKKYLIMTQNIELLHISAMNNCKGYEKNITHKIYDKKNSISYEIIQIN